MKSFIVFAVIVAAALAAPAALPAVPVPAGLVITNPDGRAVILRYESDNLGLGGYNYGYETSNKIQAQEEGTLVDVGTENEHLSVRGQFSYEGLDGVTYLVTYTADKNGFVAQGAHLPVA